MSSTPPDDRTTRARIRDTAIDCYGRLGVAGTTARKVAEAAGVSPGSVMHHFGSMEGLRVACDEHVTLLIRQSETAAFRSLLAMYPDPVVMSGAAGIGEVGAYLASVLQENSPIVAHLVDELVADAETYLQEGVDEGIVRPSEDPRTRAAVLTIWQLGTLALRDHVKRLLGVDLADPEADPEAMGAYVSSVLELFGHGIFSDAITPPSSPQEETS